MYVKTRPVGYSPKKFNPTKERKVKKSLIPQTIEVKTSNSVITKTIYHEPPQKKGRTFAEMVYESLFNMLERNGKRV